MLEEKLQKVCALKNVLFVNLYHQEPLDPKELLNTLHEYRDMVAPYVGNVSEFLYQAVKEGKNILLEGQLGTMKDPDHGIYPMVTSSSTLAAYGAIGAGIPPYEIKKIVAVTKAYSSAVGAGAFVSEIFGDEADELRRRGGDGGEFGATTGRPRRMGWYDCVASHYGCRLQGATDVALTVLDVLGYLDEIPVCVGYEIDGQVTKEFPVTCKLEKRSLYTRFCPAGNAISVASGPMKSCRKTAASTLSSSKTRSAIRLQWYPTVLAEMTSSTETARWHKTVSKNPG